MKRFTFFSLLTLAIPFVAISQNQNVIIDDVYFITGNSKTTSQADKNQSPRINQRPNYKNGAQEIVYKERNIKTPTIIRDTVFVVGQASDEKSNHFSSDFNISNWDGKTNPVIVHDTIYVSENVAENLIDSLNPNREHGYYVNGFNGSESDMEYAERIRRFHNPKYTIFIGDPRYNDALFLNNYDWNVYVDGSYAYVTPTWTNPYWWNYEYGFWGYNGGFGFGWHSPFYSGFGGFYDPWGYDGFYGYGGMYGYGNYWDPYYYGGYGGYYGNYYGYGGYWNGYSNRNKNYNEGTRRATANNTNASTRLGGTRTEGSNSTVIGGGYNSNQSRNPYTVVNGRATNAANGTSTRTSLNLNSRTVSNPVNGIGIVRNSTNRTVNINQNGNGVNTNRTSTSINTRPRTYTTTTNNIPTGNYTPRTDNSGNSSFRGSSSTVTRSTTSSGGGNASYTPSRSTYSTGSSSSGTRSSSPSYSTGGSSSSSSSSSGSSSSGGGGRSSSSGSGGGGRR